MYKRQALLAAKGITLEIRTSAGSYENLERLEKGEAEIAFVQGGIAPATARDNGQSDQSDQNDQSPLRSLGSVAYGPVWVFYRGEQRVDKLHQLDGQRVAVGEEGSGIRGLALKLLEANRCV